MGAVAVSISSFLLGIDGAVSRSILKDDASQLTGIAKKAQNRIMKGDKSLILPLISYYGTGRLYAQKKEKSTVINRIQEAGWICRLHGSRIKREINAELVSNPDDEKSSRATENRNDRKTIAFENG